MTFKISTQDGVSFFFLESSEMSSENVLERLNWNRLQDSEQLQTVFARSTVKNWVEISWRQVIKKLKRMVRQRMVRQHIDQRENGKLGWNNTVKCSKATMRRTKKSGKEGSIAGIIQKCRLKERNPWAPKFEERTQDEFLKQERSVRRDVWELTKDVHKLKKESKDTFISPAEAWVMPTPSPMKPEQRNFAIDPGASMHY